MRQVVGEINGEGSAGLAHPVHFVAVLVCLRRLPRMYFNERNDGGLNLQPANAAASHNSGAV